MAKIKQIQWQDNPRQKRYFSEGFKKQKVEEIEKNLVNISELSREYLVTRSAIYKWIYKYSVMRKKGVRQVIESESDTRKIQQLKEKVKELERIVGQKQITIDYLEKMIEVAKEEYDIDIKKNYSLQQSSGSKTTKKK